MTWDLCMGASAADQGARVLLTLTDEHAARGLLAAVERTRASWFQAEGQVAFVRPSARDGLPEPEPEPEPEFEPEAPAFSADDDDFGEPELQE